jgi:hypothetical protein
MKQMQAASKLIFARQIAHKKQHMQQQQQEQGKQEGFFED